MPVEFDELARFEQFTVILNRGPHGLELRNGMLQLDAMLSRGPLEGVFAAETFFHHKPRRIRE